MKKIFVLALVASSSVLHGAQDNKNAESKRAVDTRNDFIIDISSIAALGNPLIIEGPREQAKTPEGFSAYEKAVEFLAPYMDQELVRNMNSAQQKIQETVRSDNDKDLLVEDIATAVILADSNRFGAPALGKKGRRFFELHAEYFHATAAVLEDALGRAMNGNPYSHENKQLILIAQRIGKLEENAEAIEAMLGKKKEMNEGMCVIL